MQLRGIKKDFGQNGGQSENSIASYAGFVWSVGEPLGGMKMHIPLLFALIAANLCSPRQSHMKQTGDPPIQGDTPAGGGGNGFYTITGDRYIVIDCSAQLKMRRRHTDNLRPERQFLQKHFCIQIHREAEIRWPWSKMLWESQPCNSQKKGIGIETFLICLRYWMQSDLWL